MSNAVPSPALSAETVAATEHVEASQEKSTGYAQELKRTLTFKDLVTFGLITMLPIAPTQVYAIASIESFGMAPLVYLVGVIAMVFTALSYSAMSREFPIAGSAYSYVQRGLNPHVGFLTGWVIILDYLIIPGMLIAFSNLWLSAVLPGVPATLIIVIFAFIITFVNARGISMTRGASYLFLFCQLALIAIFLICGIKYVLIDGHGMGGLSLDPFYQPGKIDLQFIATAASIAVLGFIGFDSISTLSEETKNPTRTVGPSVVASLCLIGLLFLSQSYMASLVHPEYADLDPGMGYFDIMREVGGDALYYAFIIVGVLAVGIANALTVQSAISRVIFSMSRDKLLPGSSLLSKVHPKYKTPANATIFVGSVSVLVALFMSLDLLAKLVNFGAMTTYMLLNLSVVTHFFWRKKHRDLKGFIRYLLCPLIGFGVIAFIWSGFDSTTYLIGFAWMAIGVVLGAIRSKGYKEVPPALGEI
ncbi:APC family permease [Paenibacillus sp. SYP-B4298]|uniref:APC family permease n=1 Tax=Paenibacillus sp. SYP-B4298 TaxID=2996034 RepID=UPI0022DE4CFF|nr:APC family permease [Paenibacillus sp. SYP-B4298]